MFSNPNFIAISIASFVLLYFLLSRKKFKAKKRLGWWWFSVITLAFYIFSIGYSFYLSSHYESILSTFDSNKDGMFSGNEITPEQKEAMKNVVSDTGRNFVFIGGAIYAIIISGILVGIRKVILKVIK